MAEQVAALFGCDRRWQFSLLKAQHATLTAKGPVLRQNLNPDILVMQSAEDGDRYDRAALVPPPELWSILIQ